MASLRSRISSASRARRAAVLPVAIRCSTARRHARRDRRGAKAEIGEPHDLALAHGDAAEDLRQIFAGADAHQKLLDLAELPVAISRCA